MRKKGNIVRYSLDEIEGMIARGEDKSDFAKIDATTEEEIERQAVEDGTLLPDGWEANVIIGLPERKEHINLRVDADVLRWFKATGKGYQTRMNNVLRAFVQSRRRA
jgi:uncharacterized protein (DUF4415 family)